MNPRERRLVERRNALLLRSAELRIELAWQGSNLLRSAQPVVGIAEGTMAGARWVGRHPLAVASLVLVLALRRPRTAMRVARRALIAWRVVRFLRAWTRRR
jgi:hypothetical protein